MIIRFYGTRGSTPVFGMEYQEFGGNTTCIHITSDDNKSQIIFDAGTGIRQLGKFLIESNYPFKNFPIIFSHFHWDHIQGLPFFPQAYTAGNKIKLMAMGNGGGKRGLKDIFATQFQSEYFPVQLDKIGAEFSFISCNDGCGNLEDFKIASNKHNHPGGAYGFRFEIDGKVLTVITDCEHTNGIDQNVVNLAKGSDMLIHEAQYTTEELETKRGWGHSSYDQAIEVANLSGSQKLAVTHHDPDHDDYFLLKQEEYCRQKFSDSVLARERMEIEI